MEKAKKGVTKKVSGTEKQKRCQVPFPMKKVPDTFSTGGDWDYKTTGRNYFFDGELLSGEDFGNAHYGFTGTAGGFGEDVLVDAAGFVQVLGGRGVPGNQAGNYDDYHDTDFIKYGIDVYRNQPANNQRLESISYANTSNQTYTQSYQGALRGLTSVLQSLNETVKKLRDKLNE